MPSDGHNIKYVRHISSICLHHCRWGLIAFTTFPESVSQLCVDRNSHTFSTLALLLPSRVTLFFVCLKQFLIEFCLMELFYCKYTQRSMFLRLILTLVDDWWQTCHWDSNSDFKISCFRVKISEQGKTIRKFYKIIINPQINPP